MKTKVYYTEKQVADSGAYSPSAGKPAEVAADWLEKGLAIELVEPKPVTVDDLCKAHDRKYVEGVLNCTVSNGFGNTREDVALSLPYTSGSMYSAVKSAYKTGETTVSLTSGFHHATYSGGGGYCTFNGLIVAAMKFADEFNLVKKDKSDPRERIGQGGIVGILDFDCHYGNGTDDIINKLGLHWIKHFTSGNAGWNGDKLLSKIPSVMQMFKHCEVILYQAGGDQLAGDPLGGFLTMEQLARRDETVFRVARSLGKPVAWNLAGGYTRDAKGGIEPVLAVHRQTMEICERVYADSVLENEVALEKLVALNTEKEKETKKPDRYSWSFADSSEVIEDDEVEKCDCCGHYCYANELEENQCESCIEQLRLAGE